MISDLIRDVSHRVSLAMEGLLLSPLSLFQNLIQQKVDEFVSANPDAGEGEGDTDTAENTPVEVDIPPSLDCVLLKPIPSLNNSILDIAYNATPCRYRFIDCSRLVHGLDLRIIEYSSLENICFAATSYIWRGIIGPPTLAMSKFGSFSVAAATDGDPISIDILLHVARACLRDEIPLLWLDRVCMIQSSLEDKRWQIQHMNGLYKSCQKCYVLPGGTRRLASLEEPTLWIHRGWTLQEAVAPSKCSVIILWKHRPGMFCNPEQRIGTTGRVEVIMPGLSAQVPLRPLLRPSISKNANFYIRSSESIMGSEMHISLAIFGRTVEELRHAAALASACRHLKSTADPDGTRKYTAIWRSAMMRTSSRPVDMVFSIMGLFGVTLNPKDFNADDRAKATIALARGILEKGGAPNWLACSLSLPSHPSIPSFPDFPRTRVDGLAVYTISHGEDSREVEASILMSDIDGWLGVEDLTAATMDASGSLSFSARSVPIEWTGEIRATATDKYKSAVFEDQILRFHLPENDEDYMVSHDNKVWRIKTTESEIEHEGDNPISTYAIVLGRMFTETSARFYDPAMLLRVIVLEEHKGGRCSRPESRSWFTLNRSSSTSNWREREFIF